MQADDSSNDFDHAVNGHAVDGHAVDGHALNGHALNGHGVNNNSSDDKSGFDLEQLSAELVKPQDIRLAALNLLARREHLRAELQRKLCKRFGSEIELDTVLDQLVAENLLSDERYVESYIRQRSNKGYGPDRIEQELRQKGADTEMIGIALQDCEVDWAECACRVREKKFGAALPVDFKEKARQLRFLNYRGFGGEFAAITLEE
ncbi:MAG: regulatory protein RecX [Halieaceae bacterium]